MRPYVIPSIFTAVDKFSSVVDKMTKKMGAFAATTERNFRNAGKDAYKFGKSAGKVGLAIAAPLALAAKAAVDFEDKMADVAKVANVKIGSSDFDKISQSALNLSKTLAISAEESAGLMANLAQGGVALSDLDRVSLLAGKMGVAFGITGDMAGQSFVKTQNALGGTITETEKLMDAVNFLGNSYASSSAEVLTFLSSGGSGVARALNASGESAAAFGSHLISVGKSAEESATIMEKFTREALADKELNKIFKANGEGAKGMLAIIKKGSELSGAAQDAYFAKFGNFSTSIQLLSKDYVGLEEKVRFATDATKTANSVNQEFENRSQTTAFKLAQMKAQFTELAIKIGTAVIPIIQQLVEKVSPFITRVTDWISRNKELTGTIVKVTAVIAGLALGISALAFGVGIYKKAVVLADAATWLWNKAVIMSPIGMFTVAVLATAAAIGYLVSQEDKLTAAQSVNNKISDRVLEKTIDQQVEIEKLFGVLRVAEKGSQAYGEAMASLERMQPGLIEKYNLQEKSLWGINRAEIALKKSVRERAEAEAAGELYKEAVKNRMKLENQAASKAGQGAISEFIQGFGDYENTKSQVNERLGMARQEEKILFQKTQSPKPVVNAESAQTERLRETFKTEQSKVTLDFKNMPSWVDVANSGGSGLMVPASGSTR